MCLSSLLFCSFFDLSLSSHLTFSSALSAKASLGLTHQLSELEEENGSLRRGQAAAFGKPLCEHHLAPSKSYQEGKKKKRDGHSGEEDGRRSKKVNAGGSEKKRNDQEDDCADNGIPLPNVTSIPFSTTLHFPFASPLRFRCSSLSLTDSGAVAAAFLWRCGGGSGVNDNDGDQSMLDRNPNSSGSDSDEEQSPEIQTLEA